MENRYNSDELSFISLTRLMLNRKWLFMIAFIAVLAASLAFLFLRPEQYTVNSKIKISESYIYSNNRLYDYFPRDAEELWIFATHRLQELEDQKLDEIMGELRSEDMKSRIAKNLDIDVPTLADAASFSLDEDHIIITATTSDAEETVRINKGILDTYIEYKRAGFEKDYNDLMTKISARIEGDNQELQELIDEKGQSEAEYRTESWKPAEERNTAVIAETLSSIDLLNRKISRLSSDHEFLLGVKNNLETNRDFFINRIQAVQEAQMEDIVLDVSLKMNIVYSMITAFIIAFILTFSVALFSYSRYAGRHTG